VTAERPLACVIGDMDLIRALGLAGIRCAVVAPPGAPVTYSRFTRVALGQERLWDDPEAQVRALERFGATVGSRPVLFYQGDPDSLMVSRHRDRLARSFRFVVPDRELMEDLVDKSRFIALAQRLELPVPAAQQLRPGEHDPPEDLPLPLIVKPLIRRSDTWEALTGGAKACRVASAGELRRLWDRLAGAGLEVIAQQEVPGAESRIESYHVYVDGQGRIAGAFTGAKVRTHPAAYGHSTALRTTDAPDVARLGRDIVGRLGLIGVAKLDFKRDSGGRLWLLEVNPRFTLWHHLGAVAGLNLPAIVYADLVGLPRPPARTVRPGVGWSAPLSDLRAVRAAGRSLAASALWTARARAVSGLALDDPWPVLRGQLWPRVLGRLRPREGVTG
jgi:predicted ATP-grasp superfamily ATP-dependent carboligase